MQGAVGSYKTMQDAVTEIIIFISTSEPVTTLLQILSIGSPAVTQALVSDFSTPIYLYITQRYIGFFFSETSACEQ